MLTGGISIDRLEVVVGMYNASVEAAAAAGFGTKCTCFVFVSYVLEALRSNAHEAVGGEGGVRRSCMAVVI